MFNEYLEPTRVERPVSPTPAVLVSVTSAGTPSSTTIDQDAPSPTGDPTLMEDNPFPPVDNDPFINVFAPEPSSKVSSSGDLLHNTEDTLEIAKITRRKMNDKMKDPECVTHKVKIAPPDYSKENYLATFTIHKQLTLEQIFWSQDLIKMKEENLKKPVKRELHQQGSLKGKGVLNNPRNVTSSRFTEMHEAYTIVQTRCLELEAELSKLRDKVQKDDHTELVKCFSNLELLKPRVLSTDRYAIDVEPISPHNRDNREVHLHYLKHLKESVETLHKIVEEAKVERPLDRSIVSACRYTKHSQELLEYAIGTCLKAFNQ
ncbi:hypothetical protein Tco_0368381 [Tanacetum coccineum]